MGQSAEARALGVEGVKDSNCYGNISLCFGCFLDLGARGLNALWTPSRASFRTTVLRCLVRRREALPPAPHFSLRL